MKASKIALWVALPSLCFTVALNHVTYDDTRKLIQDKGYSRPFIENMMQVARDESLSGKMTYYLGMPGRELAHRLHSKETAFSDQRLTLYQKQDPYLSSSIDSIL
mgnify:FL=1